MIEYDPNFQPDSTCNYRETCIAMGMCQIAKLIRQEMKYRKHPELYRIDGLDAIVKEQCNHPQAIEAIEAAKSEFPELSASGSSGQIFP